jgi:hypothetical protein
MQETDGPGTPAVPLPDGPERVTWRRIAAASMDAAHAAVGFERALEAAIHGLSS